MVDAVLKVADMHEARAGNMSDVIVEAKVLVKNYTCRLRTGEFGVNVWVYAELRLREIHGYGIFLELFLDPMPA